MFSKIKSLFTDKNNPQATQQTFKHPEAHNGDASQCPFINKNKNKTDLKNEKQKKKKPKNKNDSDTESEADQKPKGGCPFMVSSGTKKNPNLGIQHQGYDEPFISKFKYYLSSNKINFDAMKNGGKVQPTIRHKFDSYPIYLKHTLFFSGEDYKKVRTFQCCSRFMAYEELRERGNKYFNKGKYLKAIDFYQRAMSLFRWLEHRQPETSSQMGSQRMIEQSVSQSQISEDDQISKIPINIKPEQENKTKDKYQTQFDEFKDKYKEFFVIYHDDNTICFDGEEMTENVDIDMRKSLLIQVYLNMAATYIKLNHFLLANTVLNDAFKLSDKVSQTYLRKAQVAFCNKSANLSELKSAFQSIQKAVCMQPHEKIFQNTNQNILKMVNIHDAKQVYADVSQKLLNRIAQKQRQNNQIKEKIENRLMQINQIQQEMIRQGKTPREGDNHSLLSQGTDYKILKRIYDKYVRIMEFYIEAKDKEQIQLAKRQFQQVLRVIQQINSIQNIKINFQNEAFGRDQTKIKNRTKNIKKQKCQEIYNSARYNFHVLQWAIKEVVNQEHQKAQRKRKQQQEQARRNRTGSQQVKQKTNYLSKLPYAMVIVPIIGIAINYLI